jgi:hypothetical protein
MSLHPRFGAVFGAPGESVSQKSRLGSHLKLYYQENNGRYHSGFRRFSEIFIVFAIVLACGNQILLTIAC